MPGIENPMKTRSSNTFITGTETYKTIAGYMIMSVDLLVPEQFTF